MCILEINFSLETIDITAFVKVREFNMQVCEEYASIWYDNFDELKQYNPSLAKELLEQFDNGEWQKNQLFVYESLEDYAYYELTEGWYADKHLDQKDYNGAPNPIDFIDLKALGLQLSRTWDESMHYLTRDNWIVETNYGWN